MSDTMRVGRMRKRHRMAIREKRNAKARLLPGWNFQFTKTDEYLAVSSPTGHAIYDDGEGGQIEVDLLNCCHCGRPFGLKRHGLKSKCLRCNAMTCGSPGCDECNGPTQKVKRFGKV